MLERNHPGVRGWILIVTEREAEHGVVQEQEDQTMAAEHPRVPQHTDGISFM